MGTEYDLISDKARVGYELGKGPWHDLSACLRSDDPRRDVIALMKIQGCFSDEAYCAEVADEIVKFIKEHSDWRVIDEYSSDIWVATDEDIAEEAAEFDEGNEDAYRKIGSRYRETAPSDESPMAIEGLQESVASAVGVIPPGSARPMMKVDLASLRQRQAELAKRQAKLIAWFAPKEIAPGETLTLKIERFSSISVRDNRQWMDSFDGAQHFDKIEVFRPLYCKVSGEQGDMGLVVEHVRVAGREQLAEPASALMFEGTFEVSMDSGKLGEFEIVVANPTDQAIKLSVEMSGKALLAAPDGATATPSRT